MLNNLLIGQLQTLPNIVCGTTMRQGGTSRASYRGLNLGAHVGDSIGKVTYNRALFLNDLRQRYGNIFSPVYLNQAHTNNILKYGDSINGSDGADAIWTDKVGVPLLIMTADCLPIMLSDGDRLCAIHAGWRGLTGDLLTKALSVFAYCTKVSAWIGPYIHHNKYEVGNEVADYFRDVKNALQPSHNEGKYHLNLGLIAITKLTELGVSKVKDSDTCTYADQRFYSHRRSQHEGFNNTGRMVSFVIKRENK